MTTQIRDFDWSAIVFDLKRGGMEVTEICRALHSKVTEGMIRQYMGGAQPAHWRGELILTLWMDRTGMDRGAAPTRPAPISHVARNDRRERKRYTASPDALQEVCRQHNLNAGDLANAIANLHTIATTTASESK